MIDGILNIYKEKGFTSHDVVAKLRGILHQKKIGHTGTLDPDATGVLPVCLGKATKVCDLLTDKDKSYRAVCQLGVETDTQDMTGEVLNHGDYSQITKEQLEECIQSFQGDIMQIPPMYSALKVNGKKLYELAREGKTIERKPRPVTIHEITLVDVDMEKGQFTMDVTCSKGTYIRTLCHDIGQKLGCLAAMDSLLRTRVSVFALEEAYTLSQIQDMMQEGEEKLAQIVCQVDSLFPTYPKLQIKDEFAAKLSNGNPLIMKFLQPFESETKGMQEIITSLSEGDHMLIYDEEGKFKAVYQKGERDLRVHKMF